MRDGDLWRYPACGCELDWEENDDGTVTLVCPSHQVGWDAGHEDGPYPMGGLVFRPTVGGGVLIAGPCMAVCLDRTSAVNAFAGMHGRPHCPVCWGLASRSAPLDGGPATLVCLRCGRGYPLEPVDPAPEPYTRVSHAFDALARVLDEGL